MDEFHRLLGIQEEAAALEEDEPAIEVEPTDTSGDPLPVDEDEPTDVSAPLLPVDEEGDGSL